MYTVEDQARMTRAENYFAWQHRLVRRELGRRVLEVGCGLGNFTGTLLDREAVVAIDIEPECVEILKRRYGGRRNLHALVCDVASPEFRRLARFRVDTCVCLNVLEHIQDDRAALEAMAAVVTPGGAIVLQVPAFQSLYGPIDRNLGHHRRYSKGSLGSLAARAGLRLRKAHYSNFVGFFGWWTNARVLKLEVQSERQIELFDRYLVPAISAVERVARPPFGQSLVAIVERP
jgi:SAM-dependent methyltransferase